MSAMLQIPMLPRFFIRLAFISKYNKNYFSKYLLLKNISNVNLHIYILSMSTQNKSQTCYQQLSACGEWIENVEEGGNNSSI
jgi:hypothetical protein